MVRSKIMRGLVVMFSALLMFSITGCDTDSTVVSKNISKEADNFKILRRVVFFNGITGEYVLSIVGFCSIHKDNVDNQLEVTCKVSDHEYKKHYFGLSDNTAYFVEQLESSNVSPHFYKVIFKPSTIIPDVEIR